MKAALAQRSVVVTFACPSCGKESAQNTYVATAFADRLRVSASVGCRACGLAQEADGNELWPEARQAFLDAEGRWALVVTDAGARRAEAAKALREVLDLVPADVLGRLRGEDAIIEGTLIELERIAAILSSFDVRTTMSTRPRTS